MKPVGAMRRRAEVGVRVRTSVVLYVLDADGDRWGWTITDARQRPVVRCAYDAGGLAFDDLARDVELVTGVRIIRVGSRLLRDDERWDVAVRSLTERDEIAYKD